MTTALAYYKALYRKINRLPIDLRSLRTAKCIARDAFRAGRVVPNSPIEDPKRYRKVSQLADSVLNGDFYLLSQLLDLIYKDPLPQKPWISQFLQTKYSAFKPVWPVVHLLHQFGKDKHKNFYDRELLKSTPESQEFLVMKEMNLSLSLDDIPIKPIQKVHHNQSIDNLVKQMQGFYKFVCRHPDVLLDHKAKSFEIVLEPTRFGLPKSVAARERDYRTKVAYMKQLLQQVRPMQREDLIHLCATASGRLETPETTINQNYFRYSSRQHANINSRSPFEKKFLNQKQLVANDRHIRFYYRDYVTKQFYETADGVYQISEARFYD